MSYHFTPSPIHLLTLFTNTLSMPLAHKRPIRNTKPIRVIFSLAGLYLHLEEGFTGKEVQNFHQKMALGKQAWPEISFPKNRGKITVAEVLNAEAGAERDQMIRLWCEEVWEAFQENRFTILRLIQGYKT